MIHLISVRNPWAYLISKGFIKYEIRRKELLLNQINEPIALHVANKSYQEKERHFHYQKKDVQKYLEIDPNTKYIRDNNHELDLFFAKLSGCIIGIIYFEKSIKINRSKNKWSISKSLCLISNSMIKTKGCLGIANIKDENVIIFLKNVLNKQYNNINAMIIDILTKHKMLYLNQDLTTNSFNNIFGLNKYSLKIINLCKMKNTKKNKNDKQNAINLLLNIFTKDIVYYTLEQINCHLICLKYYEEVISVAIFDIDEDKLLINLRLFGVKQSFRKQEYASCLIYFIQYMIMSKYDKYQLIIFATDYSLNFWMQNKYYLEKDKIIDDIIYLKWNKNWQQTVYSLYLCLHKKYISSLPNNESKQYLNNDSYWEYFKNKQWKKFDDNVSQQVEQSYKSNKYQLRFKTKNNNYYQINLMEMLMIHSNRNELINIRRKQM